MTYDGVHNYAWDAAGKMISVDTTTLTHDALGRMVEKNVSGTYTQIVYSPLGAKFALMNGQTLVKVDGTGYPAGLQGDDIPIVSRIVSVIDAYDAMVTNRCYRKGLPHAEGIRRLLESAGTQFDTAIVHTFIPIAEQEATEVFAAAGTSTSAAL